MHVVENTKSVLLAQFSEKVDMSEWNTIDANQIFGPIWALSRDTSDLPYICINLSGHGSQAVFCTGHEPQAKKLIMNTSLNKN